MIQECRQCGTIIHTRPSRVLSGRGKYCSKECRNKNVLSDHKIDCACSVCRVKRGELKKGNHPSYGHKYNPTKSQNRKNSEAIKGFYKENGNIIGFKKGNKLGWIDGRSKLNNRYPEEWTGLLRESIRQRDRYVCFICEVCQDELNRRLSVHHIDYNPKNLNPDNLISLCSSCHVKTNYNREYWLQYFKETHGK